VSALRSFPLAAAVPVGPHWDGTLATDLFAPCNTPVLAVEDGYADSYSVPQGGNAATLTFADGSGAAYYAHMSAPAGSGWFGVGSVIGYVGETGNAAGKGCHLHFAVATSPDVFAARNGSGDLDPAAYLAGVGAGAAPADGGGDQGGVSLGLLLLIGAGLVVLLWPRD
jgi:murein DD-endopeptidase MepM/ murein hydrolase activator NlpD